MGDLNHYIGGDLDTSPTGDLAMVSDTKEGEQRVLRRLLTAVQAYVWHPDYGAGLPAEVGQTLDVARIRGLIREQIFKEARVSRQPDPVITVQPLVGGVSVRIQYTDAETQQTVPLSFDINR